MTQEQRKEYRKQYREKNKEKIKQQKHEAYLRALERDPDFNAKKYRHYLELHPDGNKERYQRCLDNNPNYLAEHSQKYKESIAESKRKSYETVEGRCAALVRKYRAADSGRGFDTSNNIDKDGLVKLISGNKCYYCDETDWTRLGADRIDNSKPHTPENCICACFICNVERQTRSVEEFKEYRQLHPRILGIQKSYEIVEMKGIKVLKKRAID